MANEHLVLVVRANRRKVVTLGAVHALGVDPVVTVGVDGPSAVGVYMMRNNTSLILSVQKIKTNS